MKNQPTVVLPTLHNHLADTLLLARNVQTVISSLVKHCHTDRSRRYTRGMLICLARIITALDLDALERAAMDK